MGHSHKRKYESGARRPDGNNHGVGQTVNDLKRRRLSSENNSQPSTQIDRDDHRPYQRNRDTSPQHPDDWQVAESKSSKKARQREEIRGGYNDSKLIIANNVSQVLQIKDLQNLVLYCLSDGVAPTWLAVQNAKDIKKVVVLMVPGLDKEMLRTSQDLMETINTPDLDQASQDDTTTEISQRSSLSWLFDHVMEVRTPGNGQQNTIHSPLQAMLISPVERDQETSLKHNKKSNNVSRQTPITEFIMNADDLREAEFPIHPAAFTNKIDAGLEQERRATTGQSTSAGWVDTNIESSTPDVSTTIRTDPVTLGANIYALDCEMVQTTDDVLSLARISVVNWQGKVIIDKYVKPDLPIKNYFTQYSGITPEILTGVTTTLKDIQQELLELLTPSSIILGHSLESDLNALKLTHPFIVDTSILFPHPRGFPLRSSLKYLANKYLKREIQKQGVNGHDSVEDARAVLDLVKLKCEKGPKFGTTEANGESIFRRIARSTAPKDLTIPSQEPRTRTSAIVEYGTPEKGLGKDATYAIGCSDDAEITAGIVRSIRGDVDENAEGVGQNARIPAGGVDFVWSRFRELDIAQGWNTSSAHASITANPSNPDADARSSVDETKVQSLTKSLLNHLSEIHDSLPKGTLLILYSGTNDMRPVLKLQAIQAKFRREFKVKKWDELSVKWTDVEEQMLKRECHKARNGWGVVCVK